MIEQMRIIDNGYSLCSIPISPSIPSVNEPDEVEVVLDYIRHNTEQQALLGQVLK
jgi:3-deoxy-manno-octulosonate cytidylyltransferase (CMP-KDO synthetase)